MKLSDWAKKQGIAYLTAYRWFKDNKLPVQAYQSESGTIIVQDESDNPSEQPMAGNSNVNDVMSLFLKKTVEFSKNNATVEDFAAYIISNFTLKLNNAPSESPKYSKNKPKPEDVRKHFDQFLKPKGEKPKPAMFVAGAEELEDLLADPTVESNDFGREGFIKYGEPEVKTSGKLYEDLSSVLNSTANVYENTLGANPVRVYGSTGSEGSVIRSFETPLNYTNSTMQTFSSCALNSNTQFPTGATGGFVPTEKELRLSKTPQATDVVEAPKARRGRKSKESRNQ